MATSSTIPYATTARPQRSSTRIWVLGFVTINSFGVNLVAALLSRWFYVAGWLVREAASTLFGAQLSFLTRVHATDSFFPMYAAWELFKKNASADIYNQIVFQEHIKFQYPLTTLLPLALADRWGSSEELFSVTIWLSVLCVLLYSIQIARLARQRAGPVEPAARKEVWTAATVVVAGLSFYPLMHAYALGQLQTVVAGAFTLALFLWMAGYPKMAGAAIGVMILIKPQWAIVLIWFALRRCWTALAAGAACAALGVILTTAVFGWRNAVGYLEVLAFIARHGESYFANQSVNGILNRILLNGDNLHWNPAGFAPYHPFVYWSTAITSVAILVSAVFYPWRDRRGGVDDFACIGLAATIASPVAWNHHYSIAFPIFVWLWYSRYSRQATRGRWLWIGIAYVLASDNFSFLNVLADVPGLNILQAMMFASGLALMTLLFHRRRANSVQPLGKQSQSLESAVPPNGAFC